MKELQTQHSIGILKRVGHKLLKILLSLMALPVEWPVGTF